MLLYKDGKFMQVLEGEEPAVRALTGPSNEINGILGIRSCCRGRRRPGDEAAAVV
jgi:hypothetical protein